MRVLFAVDGLWVGGTERSLVELLPLMGTTGIETQVACLRGRSGEGIEEAARAAGAHLRILEASSFLGQVRALRRIAREWQPAILHSALFQANLVARFAAIGLPLVLLNSVVNTPYERARYEDPDVRKARLRAVQALDAVTGRWLVDHFHAVSAAAGTAAARALRVPTERITVVHRGRDARRLGARTAERRVRVRQGLGVPNDAELVVSVGRQDYQKGQSVLVAAVGRLVPRRPSIRLLVAGRSGNATPALQATSERSGLGDRVRFLGHREDVPDLLAAADLFAFPSLFEGFPGAMIEAMALGLPIVASDIPPVRELRGPAANSLLVPPNDPAALAEALAELLDDSARAAAMGESGRARYEAHFTLEEAGASMVALYRRLAGSRFT